MATHDKTGEPPATDLADGCPQPDRLNAALDSLRQIFGQRCATGTDIRNQHANTLTWIETQPPDAVVFAETTKDVQAVIEIARDHRIPIVPFGAGTSLEGHVNAPLGGISLDLSRMDKVLAVHPEDLDCIVEAGVTRTALNQHLRDTGLFFPVDPGAGEATIGGMAATRASGTCAVRYGTMREAVIGVTAVMADASIVSTASRARKSAAGYDLTRLLVGSEGTLGIITEVTLRLHGIPEATLAAVAPFPTLAAACRATFMAMATGLGLARIELLDGLQIRAVNTYSGLELAEQPTLFLEFHGTQAGAREQVDMFREIANGEGARDFSWAEGEDQRRALWKARHDALWAINAMWPGKSVLITDVCVPLSRLADCVAETDADIAEMGLIAPIVGHVGDGNFHVLVMFDPKDTTVRPRLHAFVDRLAHRAIAMDGTCTGEHGIGQGKRALLRQEAGDAIASMRAIKQALDPLAILNPGKIF